MSTTLIATRNVSDRLRGFLASSLLEVGPGIYFGARLSPAVRDRIWSVVEGAWGSETEASVVMVWRDQKLPCEHAVKTLGTPPVSLVEHDGIILTHRHAAEPPGKPAIP